MGEAVAQPDSKYQRGENVITHEMDPDPRVRTLTGSELALVGEVALCLDPPDPDRFDQALELLEARLETEVLELFVATPGGAEMVLLSHHGLDPDSFGQQDRFRRAEGFPGIVLETGSVLSSTALEAENEFVRSRVKSAGYHSVVCVPIPGDGQVGGCLLLAWRSRRPRLDRVIRESTIAAFPLGTALAVALSRIHRLGSDDDDAGALEVGFRRTTGADDVEVRVVGARGPCTGLRAHESPSSTTGRACPALVDGRVQVLGGRVGWPHACIQSECVCRARYCVPLKTGEDVWGVATVSYHHAPPVPHTRWLPAALWMAEAVATRPPVDVRASSRPDGPDVAGVDRLTLRCFGGFEVFLEERRLTTADFGRSKCLELLARLAAAGGRPLSLREIACDLWPGAEPDLLPNRFHVTLSALRGVIEPGSARTRKWTHVRSNSRGYFLDPDSSTYVDLWHVESLLRSATEPWRGRRSLDPTDAVEHAARLCRGDLFAGIFDSEWSKEVARRWRERTSRRVQDLADSPYARTIRADDGS